MNRQGCADLLSSKICDAVCGEEILRKNALLWIMSNEFTETCIVLGTNPLTLRGHIIEAYFLQIHTEKELHGKDSKRPFLYLVSREEP